MSSSTLTRQERRAIIAKLLSLHSSTNEKLSRFQSRVADPNLFDITIREQKRFLQEYSRHFSVLLAEHSREVALERAFAQASHIYLDMIPDDGENPASKRFFRDVEDKLRRALASRVPTLFWRMDASGDWLEKILEEEVARAGLHIEVVTCTPFTDRAQLIGSFLPIAGEEQLAFCQGVVCRLAQLAAQNPRQTYVLLLAQIEAVAAKTRAILHHLLLTGEIVIPEIAANLVLPDNLRILTTLGEKAVLEDSAFYNRFLRKAINRPSRSEVMQMLGEIQPLPEDLEQHLLALHFGEENGLSLGNVLLLARYIRGCLEDLEREPTVEETHAIVMRESTLFCLGGKKFSHTIAYDKQRRCLIIDGVALTLAANLCQELENRIVTLRQAESQAIRELFCDCLGLSLTNDSLRILSGVARNIRYGNRVVVLEGPTGTGKTFLAECLAKILGIAFYGEPIHHGSKLDRWLGVFKPDHSGNYYLDHDTPFLRNFREGGVTALSELNTAVQNDYAKLSWWLIPLARGEEKIVLNEYPSREEETPLHLRRHPDSIVIIDINPRESYAERGDLPAMLVGFTPIIWVEGVLREAEVRLICEDYLRSFTGVQHCKIVDYLGQFHYWLQRELRVSPRVLARDYPHTVSIRELRRACDFICANSSCPPQDNFLNAVMIFYMAPFRHQNEKDFVFEAAVKLLDKSFVPLPLQYASARSSTLHRARKIAARPPRHSFWQMRSSSLWSLLPNLLAPVKKLIDHKSEQKITATPETAICEDEREKSLQELSCTLRGHNAIVSSIEILDDVKNEMVIVSGDNNGVIRIWRRLGEGNFTVQKLSGHIRAVRCIKAFWQDDRLVIVSGSLDNSLRIWREQQRDLFSVKVLRGHRGAVNCIQVLLQKKRLTIVSGSSDTTIKIWREKALGHFYADSFSFHKGSVVSLAMYRQQNILHIISADHDGDIKIWQLGTFSYKEPMTLRAHDKFLKKMQVLDDKPLTIISTAIASIKIWREVSPGCFLLRELREGSLYARDLLACRDYHGNLAIIVGEKNGDIKIWQEKAKTVDFRTISSPGHPHSLAILRRSGKPWMLASGEGDYGVRLWLFDGIKQTKHQQSLQRTLNHHKSKQTIDFLLRQTLLKLSHPTLLLLPAERDPSRYWRDLAKTAEIHIEKIRAGEFLDSFSLFGGYILDENASKEGKRCCKWVSGILPQLAEKARQAGAQRLFIAVFENYHYLRPKVAVALNMLLQEGYYYSPMAEKPVSLPTNLRFLAIASQENELRLSLAEQSRWAKIFVDEPETPAKKRTPLALDFTPLRFMGGTASSEMVATKEFKSITQQLLTALSHGQIAILEGEPGGGKTDIAIDIARRFGRRFFVYSAHSRSHIQDFIGSYTQDEGGSFILTARPDNGSYRVPFLDFFTSGGVFIIDEGAVGRGAHAVIAWMTGIARGEAEIFLNEHPGFRRRLQRHPEFDLIITTNPPHSTPGRMTIPREITTAAAVITVDNRLRNDSYTAIANRFYNIYDLGIAPGGSISAAKWLPWHVTIHRAIYDFVNSREELQQRHLVTLRDLKRWVAMLAHLACNTDREKAFFAAVDIAYLQQFPRAIRGALIDALTRLEIPIHENLPTFSPLSQRQFLQQLQQRQLLSEQQWQKNLQVILAAGFHPMLIFAAGARPELADFAAQQKYTLFVLEGTPETTVQDLIGGLFPTFAKERNFDRDFCVKPGFLSRHMTEETLHKKLLVIRNVDALPERVRACLNNFLLKGYLEQKDDSGRVAQLRLPANVHLLATIAEASNRPCSPAFYNRFVKLHIPAPTSFASGFSELLQLLIQEYSLSEANARIIQNVYLLTHQLDVEEGFWPSGKKYGFTVQHALLHGEFFSFASEKGKEHERILIEEALRVYGCALREHPKDYQNFREIILKSIFRHDFLARPKKQSIRSFATISPSSLGYLRRSLDARHRLSLVPHFLSVLNDVLYGWQAKKMVCLVGETGVAKTTIGIFLARLLGFSAYVYSVHGESKNRDLTVSLQLGADGRYQLQEREFLQRIRRGKQVIIIDEANVRPELLWFFNGFARAENELTVEFPAAKTEPVELAEDVYFLFTMNPENYTGRGEIPVPFAQNSFRIWLDGYYPQRELVQILEDFLVNENDF